MLSENNKDFNFDFEEDTCSAEPKDEKEILFKVGKKRVTTYTLQFDSEEQRNMWLSRINKTIQMSKEYTRTHGIEIAHQIVDHPIAKQAIQQQGHLDLSVWDFAGQHEYYNNHHYFLQSRSIFLILYKLKEQRDSEKGLKGLSFWFKSLSCHLKQDPNELKPSFSIVVIGTHLDHESVKKDQQEREERGKQVKKLAKESGGYFCSY